MPSIVRPTVFESIRLQVAPLLRKEGIRKAAIFGSVARDEATPTSDVDIVAVFPARYSLVKLIHLQQVLEHRTRRPVDLVSMQSLHFMIKDAVLREQRPIL